MVRIVCYNTLSKSVLANILLATLPFMRIEVEVRVRFTEVAHNLSITSIFCYILFGGNFSDCCVAFEIWLLGWS